MPEEVLNIVLSISIQARVVPASGSNPGTNQSAVQVNIRILFTPLLLHRLVKLLESVKTARKVDVRFNIRAFKPREVAKHVV